MKILSLIFLLIITTAKGNDYSITLSPVHPAEWYSGIPEGHTVHSLSVDVSWGLIGVTLSFDPSNPETVVVGGRARSIAQGYRFYLVDSPDSKDRVQFCSNYGDDIPDSTFIINSGGNQFLTYESSDGESGWVELGYDSSNGLYIKSQNQPQYQSPPPFITMHNNQITIIPYSIYGVIQQSTDLINWTDIGTEGQSVSTPIASVPTFFRERCP